MRIPAAAAVFALFSASLLSAEPLREARVNRIINDVRIVNQGQPDRPAKLQEAIRANIGLATGVKSRSELVFQDDTLMRLGPESYFSFVTGSRDVSFRKGTMLLQVPKGLGGTKIRTAAITAAITGTTVLFEHRPGRHYKILVLEGSVRLTAAGRFGDSLLLRPGQMVIMPPGAKRIPDPVNVDLKRVVQTSSLVTMGGKTLPSMPLIIREIWRQANDVNRSNLVRTNLEIDGQGTRVGLLDFNTRTLQERGTNGGTPTPPDSSGPAPVSGDISMVSNGIIKVKERHQAQPNAGRGGNITITSNKKQITAIEVENTGELLSLLDAAAAGPGGTIALNASGGAIVVEGGKLQADRGTINISHSGAAGKITLNNSLMSADVIKVSALGANGTLNVGGGTISADSVIRLFAGGSNGAVVFTDNVSLNGNSAKTIAGHTVTINDGKVVTVNGPAPASVYTNIPNYSGFGGNGSTTGTFGGQGATTQPLSSLPPGD